jgi:hypothetical protein
MPQKMFSLSTTIRTNKLERLDQANHYNLVLYVRVIPPCKLPWTLVHLLSNISIGFNVLQGTNALAYLFCYGLKGRIFCNIGSSPMSNIWSKKLEINRLSREKCLCYKTFFSSSFMLRTNKLECLSLATLRSPVQYLLVRTEQTLVGRNISVSYSRVGSWL